jgi:hypothetical protein
MGCGGSADRKPKAEKKPEEKGNAAAAKAKELAAAKAKEPAAAKASEPAADPTAVVAGGGPTPNYGKFKETFAPLTNFEPASKAARKDAWGKADPNGNGQCSLAELDAWIKATLLTTCAADGEEVWKQFKASYIRAFSDARDIGKDVQLGTSNCSTDDFVQKRTFRVFISYLVVYAEMYDAFAVVDGGGAGVGADDDRKISLDEMKAGCSKLNGFSFACLQGISEAKAEEVFKAMDADGKGSILLSEWCRFIEQAEQKAGTECGKLLAIGDGDGDE